MYHFYEFKKPYCNPNFSSRSKRVKDSIKISSDFQYLQFRGRVAFSQVTFWFIDLLLVALCKILIHGLFPGSVWEKSGQCKSSFIHSKSLVFSAICPINKHKCYGAIQRVLQSGWGRWGFLKSEYGEEVQARKWFHSKFFYAHFYLQLNFWSSVYHELLIILRLTAIKTHPRGFLCVWYWQQQLSIFW